MCTCHECQRIPRLDRAGDTPQDESGTEEGERSKGKRGWAEKGKGCLRVELGEAGLRLEERRAVIAESEVAVSY